MGGMSLGTLLTIFVVPTMYSIFARKTVPGAKMTEEQTTPNLHAHELIAK
uniref:RND multidrug efflux transporter n=1 Tax=uncultured bacterium A1Q1_fos_1266 TaxID=1256546 RepID=L7VYZ6_9BACT|nr:RND multidrug efflux transporter [uncultured bacterium A1Q1_fos_1266]